MSDVISLGARGYKFLKGVYQYSAGVASESGYRIERTRFHRTIPMEQGFDAIAKHLESRNRPPTALCACELRSPRPMTEDEFLKFNTAYVSRLEKWNILHNGANPIARTNVCPQTDPPPTVSFYAFSYTIEDSRNMRNDFIIAGSGECPEGKSNYRDHIVRLGDTSLDGMREKVRWVLSEMERRMSALGHEWEDATGTHAYTVHDIYPILRDDIASRGAMPCGLSWHLTRPPVEGLDFEMDVRSVAREFVV